MGNFFNNLHNFVFNKLSLPSTYSPINKQKEKSSINIAPVQKSPLDNYEDSWENTLKKYNDPYDLIKAQQEMALEAHRQSQLKAQQEEEEKKKEEEENNIILKQFKQQKEEEKAAVDENFRRDAQQETIKNLQSNYLGQFKEQDTPVQTVKSVFKTLNLPWKPEEFQASYESNLNKFLKEKEEEKDKIKKAFDVYEYKDEFGETVPVKYYKNQHLSDKQIDALAEQNVIKNNVQIDSEGRPFNEAAEVFKKYHTDKDREYMEKNGITEDSDKLSVKEGNDLTQMFYMINNKKDESLQEFWEQDGMEEMYYNNLKQSLVNTGKVDEEVFNDLWRTNSGRAQLINFDLYKRLKLRFPDSPIEFDIDNSSQQEMFQYNMGMLRALKDYRSIADSIRDKQDEGKFDKLDEFVEKQDSWIGKVGAGICYVLGKVVNAGVDVGSWLYNQAYSPENPLNPMNLQKALEETGADLGYNETRYASLTDKYGYDQEQELVRREVKAKFGNDSEEQKQQKARAFEKLSEDVSPLYKNEKDDDFYMQNDKGDGPLEDEYKAQKFNEYLVRGELYGWDRAAQGVQQFWQDRLSMMQSLDGPHPIKGTFFRTGRTLATLCNDIFATCATGVGMLLNPMILGTQMALGDDVGIEDLSTVEGMTRKNALIDWAAGIQETGCWSPTLQAKYKDLGINATQIYKTIAEQNSFLSGADIWDAIGQYGFTAGTMLVTMGGSAAIKAGVTALSKKALQNLTLKEARRQAAKLALKSTADITKEEMALMKAVKSAQSKLYWGNMGVAGFSGTIEGAIESRATYDEFMRLNKEIINQKIDREREQLSEQNTHQMAQILRSKNPTEYQNLDDQQVVNNYYNSIKQDALDRAEDDALDAASLNFWLNSVINGAIKVTFQAALLSNDIRSVDFIRRSQRNLLNVTRNNGSFQVTAAQQSPWKTFGSMFKSSGGEFLEEYAQNISNAASQAAFQTDMDGYLKCLFDDKKRADFQSDIGSAITAFAKQVMDSATSKSAVKEGLMGFLSSAIGGFSPGAGIQAFLQAKASGASTGKAVTQLLKNLYSGGVLQEIQKMRAEKPSQELTDWMTAVLNDKNGEDFLIKTMGATNLKERLAQQLEDGDLMSARDTMQDYLTQLCLVMEAGKDSEQVQAIQRRWEAFSKFKNKVEIANGRTVDIGNFFNDDGSFTLTTEDSVQQYKALRSTQLQNEGINDEEQIDEILNQEIEIASQIQSAVTTARQGSDYGNATDLEITQRIQKNAEEFLKLQQRVKEARKEVIKMFGGREGAVDPYVSQALIRGIITQEDAQKRFDSVHAEVQERQQSLGESTMSQDTARKAVMYGSVAHIDDFIQQTEDKIDEQNKIIANTNQNTDDGKRKVIFAQYQKAQLEEELKEAKADKARAQEAMAQQAPSNSVEENDYYEFTAADIAAMDISTRQQLINNYKNPKYKKLYSAKQLQAVRDYINAIGSKSENYDQISDQDVYTLLEDEKALNTKRETYNDMLRQYLANPNFLSGTVKTLRRKARTAILREEYKDHLQVKSGETLREASVRIENEIESLKQKGKVLDSQVLRSLKNQMTHFKNLEKLYNKLYKDRQDSVATVQLIAEHSEEGLSQEAENAIAALSAMVESIDIEDLGDENFDEIAALEAIKSQLEQGNFDNLLNSLFQKDSKGNYIMDTFVTDKNPIKELMQDNEYTGYNQLSSEAQKKIDSLMQKAKDLLSNYLARKNSNENSTQSTETVEKGTQDSVTLGEEASPVSETSDTESATSEEVKGQESKQEKKTTDIVRGNKNVGEREKANVQSQIPDNKEVNRFLKDHGAHEARATYEFNDGNPNVYFMVSKKKGYNTNGPVIYVVAPARKSDKKKVSVPYNGVLVDYVVLGVLPSTTSKTLNMIAAETYDKLSDSRDGALLFMDGGQLNLVKGSLGHVGKVINISSINDANQMPLLKEQLDSDEKIDAWIQDAHTEGGTKKLDKEMPEVGGLFFKRAPKRDENTGVISEVNIFDDFRINTSEGELSVAEILNLTSKKGEDWVIRALSNNEFFKAFFEEWEYISSDYPAISSSKNPGTLLYNRLIQNFVYLGKVQADWEGNGILTLTVGSASIQLQIPTDSTNGVENKKLGLKALNFIYKDYNANNVPGATRLFNYYYPEIVYGFLPNSEEFKQSDGFKIKRQIELDALRLKGLIKAGLIIGYASTENYRTIEVINPFYKVAPTPQRKADEDPGPKPPAGAKGKDEVYATEKIVLTEQEKKEIDNVKNFVDTLSSDEENEDGVHLENDDPHADFYEERKDPSHKFVRVSHVEQAYSTDNKEDEAETFIDDGNQTIGKKVSLPLGNTIDTINRNVLQILEDNPSILDTEDVDALYDKLCSMYEGGKIPNFIAKDEKIVKTYLKDLIYLKQYCNSQSWILFPSDVSVWGALEVVDSNGKRTGTIDVAGTLDLLAYDVKNKRFIIIDFKTRGENDSNEAYNYVRDHTNYRIQVSTYYELLRQRIQEYNSKQDNDANKIPITDDANNALLFPVMLTYNLTENPDDITVDEKSNQILKNGNPIRISIWGRNSKAGGPIRAAGIANKEIQDKESGTKSSVQKEDIFASKEALPFKGLLEGRLKDYSDMINKDEGLEETPLQEAPTPAEAHEETPYDDNDNDDDDDDGTGAASLDSKRNVEQAETADFYRSRLRPVDSVKLGKVRKLFRNIKNLFKRKSIINKAYYYELANIFFEGDLDAMKKVVGDEKEFSKNGLKQAQKKISQYYYDIGQQEDKYLYTLEMRHILQQLIYDFIEDRISFDTLIQKVRDLDADPSVIPEIMDIQEKKEGDVTEYNKYIQKLKLQYTSTIQLWREDVYKQRVQEMQQFFANAKAKSQWALKDAVEERLKSIITAVNKDNYDLYDEDWDIQKEAWNLFASSNGISTNIRTALQRIIKTTKIPEYRQLCSYLLAVGGSLLDIEIRRDNFDNALLEGMFESKEGTRTITISNNLMKNKEALERVLLHECIHAMVQVDDTLRQAFKSYQDKVIEKFKEAGVDQNFIDSMSKLDEFIAEFLTDPVFQMTIEAFAGEINTTDLMMNVAGKLGIKSMSKNGYKAIHQIFTGVLNNLEDYTKAPLTEAEKHRIAAQDVGDDNVEALIEFLDKRGSNIEEYESSSEEQRKKMRECSGL